MKNIISVAVETVRILVILGLFLGGCFLIGVTLMKKPPMTQSELSR